MNTLPAASFARECGPNNNALEAGPSSPMSSKGPGLPAPTTVVIEPPATRRTRLFRWSAMSREPSASASAPEGSSSLALVAGPPSPLKPD